MLNMKIKVCNAAPVPAPNVYEPSVWNWLCVALPASIILSWYLDF